LVYKEIVAFKDAGQLYKKGLEKFPSNAILLYEFADLEFQQKNEKAAVALWEKSIIAEPNYANNYYALAKYYFSQQQWIKAALLGENFVNLESFTKRTKEIKGIIADSYKQFYIANKSVGTGFYAGVSNGLLFSRNNDVINPESLTAIRKTFITEWPKQQLSDKYPYRLFDHHQQLVKEEIFSAYNQWLFDIEGTGYDRWKATHANEAEKFSVFQKGRLYKIPKDQFYQ